MKLASSGSKQIIARLVLSPAVTLDHVLPFAMPVSSLVLLLHPQSGKADQVFFCSFQGIVHGLDTALPQAVGADLVCAGRCPGKTQIWQSPVSTAS